MSHPKTDEELIELSKQLMAIESTKDNLEGLQQAVDFIANMIKQTNPAITIERFERNNKPSLLAYAGAERPASFKVLLNGHVDVVEGTPDLFEPKIRDGKLYGRGAHDEKPAVVAATELFCRSADKVNYPLGLQIVSDEETDGHDGTLLQIEQGVRADFIIAVECGRSLTKPEIANEAKGAVWMSVEFGGEKSHAAYPWKGKNALAACADFIAKLHEAYPTPVQDSFVTTATPTLVQSNNQTQNSVPDHAWLGLDIRYVPDDPNFQSVATIEAFMKSLNPHATPHIRFLEPPLFCDPEFPTLLQLKEAAEEVEGTRFNFTARHATSDGRLYTPVGGQACEFGVAGEHQHGAEEHITLQSFTNFRQTIEKFLAKVNDSHVKNQPQFAETASAVDAKTV